MLQMLQSTTRRMLISKYRDPDSLPLAKGLDENKAESYAMLVYSIASLVFATIFIAYFQIDALKEDVTTITTESLAGQTCYSLTKVNAQVPFEVEAFRNASKCPAYASSSPDPSFPLCTPAFDIQLVGSSIPAPVIRYDASFYETYGACLQAVSTKCNWLHMYYLVSSLGLVFPGHYFLLFYAKHHANQSTYFDMYRYLLQPLPAKL